MLTMPWSANTQGARMWYTRVSRSRQVLPFGESGLLLLLLLLLLLDTGSFAIVITSPRHPSRTRAHAPCADASEQCLRGWPIKLLPHWLLHNTVIIAILSGQALIALLTSEFFLLFICENSASLIGWSPQQTGMPLGCLWVRIGAGKECEVYLCLGSPLESASASPSATVNDTCASA